jgi:hypothetical protein
MFCKLFRDKSRVTRLWHSETEPIAIILRLLRSSRNMVLKSNFYAVVLT